MYFICRERFQRNEFHQDPEFMLTVLSTRIIRTQLMQGCMHWVREVMVPMSETLALLTVHMIDIEHVGINEFLEITSNQVASFFLKL